MYHYYGLQRVSHVYLDSASGERELSLQRPEQGRLSGTVHVQHIYIYIIFMYHYYGLKRVSHVLLHVFDDRSRVCG